MTRPGARLNGAVRRVTAGLFAVATASAENAAPGDQAQVKCTNSSACKGHGACKTNANSCKGQNACKGQSFTETTAAQCAPAGGHFEAAH